MNDETCNCCHGADCPTHPAPKLDPKILRVTTETGSVYALLAARLKGDRATESRTRPDKVWQNYHAVQGPTVGSRLFIAWTPTKYRLTSLVTEVVEIPGRYAGEISDNEILEYHE